MGIGNLNIEDFDDKKYFSKTEVNALLTSANQKITALTTELNKRTEIKTLWTGTLTANNTATLAETASNFTYLIVTGKIQHARSFYFQQQTKVRDDNELMLLTFESTIHIDAKLTTNQTKFTFKGATNELKLTEIAGYRRK